MNSIPQNSAQRKAISRKIQAPEGKPLITCICGQPLYVRQNGNIRDVDEAEELKQWRQSALDNASMPGEMVNPVPLYEVEAVQPFVFVWAQAPQWISDEKAIVGKCPNLPRCGRRYRIDIQPDEYGDVDFDPIDKHDGKLMDAIAKYSPHLRIPDKSAPDTVEIWSRGIQGLRLTTSARKRFAAAWDRAERAGLTEQDLPEWTRYATDEQFLQWQRVIDNLIKAQ